MPIVLCAEKKRQREKVYCDFFLFHKERLNCNERGIMIYFHIFKCKASCHDLFNNHCKAEGGYGSQNDINLLEVR